MSERVRCAPRRALQVLLALGAILPATARAQDRLKLMPGADNFARVSQQLQAMGPLMVSGSVLGGGGGFGGRAGGRGGRSWWWGDQLERRRQGIRLYLERQAVPL